MTDPDLTRAWAALARATAALAEALGLRLSPDHPAEPPAPTIAAFSDKETPLTALGQLARALRLLAAMKGLQPEPETDAEASLLAAEERLERIRTLLLPLGFSLSQTEDRAGSQAVPAPDARD